MAAPAMPPRPSFLAAISTGDPLSRLRKVPVGAKDKGVDVAGLLSTEPAEGAADETRDYFFKAAVDKWYEDLKAFTFESRFTPIGPEEAHTVVAAWKAARDADIEAAASGGAIPLVTIPAALEGLTERVDAILHEHFPSPEGVFVKLSTRSPKDSRALLRRATAAYRARLDDAGNIPGAPPEGPHQDNARLVALSEEMVRAASIRTGREAVALLLDSDRVGEDLMYAFDEEGKAAAPVTLVVRAWDARIRPQCEFRGFVWEGRLTCIGQYWHSLHFPELEVGAARWRVPLFLGWYVSPSCFFLLQEHRDAIVRDLCGLFESIRASLPVPTAMLDLAWLGPGEGALLIEVNPLMEGLGSFKGSTGLFDFYADGENSWHRVHSNCTTAVAVLIEVCVTRARGGGGGCVTVVRLMHCL